MGVFDVRRNYMVFNVFENEYVCVDMYANTTISRLIENKVPFFRPIIMPGYELVTDRNFKLNIEGIRIVSLNASKTSTHISNWATLGNVTLGELLQADMSVIGVFVPTKQSTKSKEETRPMVDVKIGNKQFQFPIGLLSDLEFAEEGYDILFCPTLFRTVEAKEAFEALKKSNQTFTLNDLREFRKRLRGAIEEEK